MQIQEAGNEIIILNPESNWMGEAQQRELLLWFKVNKPQLVGEIICEDCPEHTENVYAERLAVNEVEKK